MSIKGKFRADLFGARILIAFLEMQPDMYRAAKKQFYIIETLHAIGVYALYRDLTVLADSICSSGMQRTEQFQTCLAWDRSQYLKASSVFGQVHRPVLLRTKAVMHELMKSREEQSGLLPEERKWGVTEEAAKELLAKGDTRKLEFRMWYAQNGQRYILHDTLVDAAVKLTNHTCATGWNMKMSGIDSNEEDGRFFYMQFFGMEDAIRRTQKIVQGKRTH